MNSSNSRKDKRNAPMKHVNAIAKDSQRFTPNSLSQCNASSDASKSKSCMSARAKAPQASWMRGLGYLGHRSEGTAIPARWLRMIRL